MNVDKDFIILPESDFINWLDSINFVDDEGKVIPPKLVKVEDEIEDEFDDEIDESY